MMIVRLRAMIAATGMHELALVTVFLGGFLGSAHCVAMCGGIATAMGAGQSARWWQGLLYQLGRITSYASAGAAAGAFGVVVGRGISQSHWIEYLRLLTACLIVLIGLDLAIGTLLRVRWLRAPEWLGSQLWRRLAPLARRWVPEQPEVRAFALGLLWGWLPCGLVYSALVTAAVAGSAPGGMAMMLAFGLGTLPAMYGLTQFGAWLPRRGGMLSRLLGAVIVAGGLWTAVVPLGMLTGGMSEHHMPMHHAGDMH